MPFNPDSPATVEIPATQQVVADTYHILRINITRDPNDPTKTNVFCKWAWGAVVDGVFIQVGKKAKVLDQATVLSKMVESTADSESFYDAIKRAIYEVLVATGEIPSGSIS